MWNRTMSQFAMSVHHSLLPCLSLSSMKSLFFADVWTFSRIGNEGRRRRENLSLETSEKTWNPTQIEVNWSLDVCIEEIRFDLVWRVAHPQKKNVLHQVALWLKHRLLGITISAPVSIEPIWILILHEIFATMYVSLRLCRSPDDNPRLSCLRRTIGPKCLVARRFLFQFNKKRARRRNRPTRRIMNRPSILCNITILPSKQFRNISNWSSMIPRRNELEHVCLNRNTRWIFQWMTSSPLVLRLQCVNEQMAIFAKQRAVFLEDGQRKKLLDRKALTTVYDITGSKIWTIQGVLLGHVHVHNGKITR